MYKVLLRDLIWSQVRLSFVYRRGASNWSYTLLRINSLPLPWRLLDFDDIPFLFCLLPQHFTIDGMIRDPRDREEVKECFRAKCLVIRGECSSLAFLGIFLVFKKIFSIFFPFSCTHREKPHIILNKKKTVKNIVPKYDIYLNITVYILWLHNFLIASRRFLLGLVKKFLTVRSFFPS